jgi:hypothetical protein
MAWDLIMHAGVAVVSLATFAAFADVGALLSATAGSGCV